MAVKVRTFECYTAGCATTIEFDVRRLTREKSMQASCPVCKREWNLSLDGSSCCKVYVRIVSNTGNGTIVKVKSYPK